MKLRGVPRAHGLDCAQPLSAKHVEHFRLCHQRFVFRYLNRWEKVNKNPKPDIGGWAYSLSLSERDLILAGGLAIGLVQFCDTVDDPHYSSDDITGGNGRKLGRAMVSNAKALGMPLGMHLYFDYEFAEGPTKAAVIDHLTGWGAVVRDAGYRAGLYVGCSILDSQELYRLPYYDSYWQSGAIVPEVHIRGYAITQTPATTQMGMDVDHDQGRYDALGDRPRLVTA
jgi:hypothetical protein